MKRTLMTNFEIPIGKLDGGFMLNVGRTLVMDGAQFIVTRVRSQSAVGERMVCGVEVEQTTLAGIFDPADTSAFVGAFNPIR